MLNDTETSAFVPKAGEPGSDEYKRKVAEPTMQAIDAMPVGYRQCVYEFGYIDVYRAWRRGWTVERIRRKAESAGGRFEL